MMAALAVLLKDAHHFLVEGRRTALQALRPDRVDSGSMRIFEMLWPENGCPSHQDDYYEDSAFHLLQLFPWHVRGCARTSRSSSFFSSPAVKSVSNPQSSSDLVPEGDKFN